MVGGWRQTGAQMSESDPLAGFLDRFVVPDPDLVYLDGNSLGRLPKATAARLRAVVEDEWGDGLVRSWERWVDAPVRVGDRIGEVVGAGPGQVLCCDSTTVNLHKLVHAALDAFGPLPLVVDPGEFPTDRYVLEGVAAARGVPLLPRTDERSIVVRSLVDYRTGELREPSPSPHVVIWDLSHAAGAVPVHLDRWGVDLAVGCTYKHLLGGPGSPGYLFVRRELQERLRSPIQGWFGQREQFAMGPRYEPAAGIERFHAGTPPILGLAAAEEGVRLVAEAGIDRIHAKAMALTSRLVDLADEHLAPLGFEVASPRDPARRGAHVALRHPEARAISRALVEQAKVVPDFRGPDVLRVGLSPLSTPLGHVDEGVRRVADLVARGGHAGVDVTGRVT
jgi:kynureninase